MRLLLIFQYLHTNDTDVDVSVLMMQMLMFQYFHIDDADVDISVFTY